MVIYAMCDYLAFQDCEPDTPQVVTVQVNDGKLRAVELQAGNSPKIEIPGGSVQITDAIGNVVGSVQQTAMGSTLLNTLQQPMLNYDPCSGNVTDAIGRLTGRTISRPF